MLYIYESNFQLSRSPIGTWGMKMAFAKPLIVVFLHQSLFAWPSVSVYQSVAKEGQVSSKAKSR